MNLRSKNTIAGAVCRAILRAEAEPGFVVAESAAYKCALVDMGCDPLQLCEDARRDAHSMLRGVVSRPDREKWYGLYYGHCEPRPSGLATTRDENQLTRQPFVPAYISAAGHSIDRPFELRRS